MLTVYDSFTENLYSWAMLPNGILNAQQTGVQDFLIDANGNRYDYDTPVLYSIQKRNYHNTLLVL